MRRARPIMADRKRRLLEAGLSLLRERPIAEITVSMIAERAGMARGLIFYYFGDKDNFLQSVAYANLEDVRRRLAENDPATANSPIEWLTHNISIFMESMEADPAAMRTILELSTQAEAKYGSVGLNEFSSEHIMRAFKLPDDPLLKASLASWGQHSVDLVLRARSSGGWEPELVAKALIAEVLALIETLRPPST